MTSRPAVITTLSIGLADGGQTPKITPHRDASGEWPAVDSACVYQRAESK